MAGIEQPQYTVNVSQENLINKFAVQGEENSRVLTLHLVENVSTENALQQTEIRQKPLDLTGCTARLYTKKPDGNATFINGEIIATGADGNPNTVTFVLSQQTTAAAGNAHCTVAVFGSNGTELKATGITLDIAADDMEQTIVSTSEFVSLAEALNKAESAEKIAEDSAAEINQTVSAASTELQSLKTQSSDIAAAETARVGAEGKRVTAESDRATAEGKRQTAETARSEAESQRTNNESTRQTAEAARATAESSRASEESKRATAETARASAEQTRVQQESGRATAETARADAESKRTSDETVRSDAEGKRATAEQGRVDAESARVTAEQARQAAESSRQTAETARESASQTAVNNADTATTRANTAAKAAEDVVAGDIGTAVDQRIAAKTNIASGIAGYDSMQTALAGKANKADIPTTAAQVHARADDWMPTAAQIGGIFPYSDCGDVETDLNTLVIPGLYKINNYKAIHTFYSYSGKYEYIIVSSEGFNSATVQAAVLCTPATSSNAYVTIRATTDCITWTTTVSNADLSQLSNTLAKCDLSNITNAIFKAKAESAGVGGGYVRQSTAPTNTSLLWMDSANSNIMKYYNGTAWTPQPSVWGPET